MFYALNSKLQSYTVICSCISTQKQVYLHSDRTMHIKLEIEFQTASDKNVTGHVTYLESSIWGSSPHFPASQFK